MKKILFVTLCLHGLVFTHSIQAMESGKATKNEQNSFYLSPESPLNKDSLDLSQALFIGETSLSFNLRNPLDGTSGGNTCSSCSH